MRLAHRQRAWQPRAAVRQQEAMQLDQRLAVHLALELDHRLERHPVLVPAPGVELGMAAGAQLDVAVAARHAQQVPDLLLAAVGAGVGLPRATRPPLRHFVAQPVARATEDADMRALQADLLLELAVHRLHRRLAMIDAALRELPGVLIDALVPEDFVPLVGKDDADVRTVAFLVEHGCAALALARIAQRFFHSPSTITTAVRTMRTSRFFIATLKEVPAEAE